MHCSKSAKIYNFASTAANALAGKPYLYLEINHFPNTIFGGILLIKYTQ